MTSTNEPAPTTQSMVTSTAPRRVGRLCRPIEMRTFATFHPQRIKNIWGDRARAVFQEMRCGFTGQQISDKLGILRQHVHQLITRIIDEQVVILDHRCPSWSHSVYCERIASAWQVASANGARVTQLNDIVAHSGFTIGLVRRICDVLALPYAYDARRQPACDSNLQRIYNASAPAPTIAALARVAQVSQPTVYRWLQKTQLPYTDGRSRTIRRLSARVQTMSPHERIVSRETVTSIVLVMHENGLSVGDIMSNTGLTKSDITYRLRVAAKIQNRKP